MKQGKYSQKFENTVSIVSAASVAGKKGGGRPSGEII